MPVDCRQGDASAGALVFSLLFREWGARALRTRPARQPELIGCAGFVRKKPRLSS
jgi:hypothetical protein